MTEQEMMEQFYERICEIKEEMDRRRAESPVLQWIHAGMPVETGEGVEYLDERQRTWTS